MPVIIMPSKARLYVGVVTAIGFALLLQGLLPWKTSAMAPFLGYLVVALCVAGLKVTLPGVKGTMSVTFLFVLFGMLELSLPETLVIASLLTAVQCAWHAGKRARLVHLIFNVASVGTATVVTEAAYRTLATSNPGLPAPVLLLVAAGVFFFLNTLPVAGIISLTENRGVGSVWYECFFWSFPYYFVGAALAGLMSLAHRYAGWQTSLMVIPVVFLVYHSYQLYLHRLDSEKKHAEEMAGLHLRTIEALALAIEAKDHTTHAHLQRVQVYAVEVAKELGLGESDLEAVRAAALLHDIGKLAVPEHIISKAGKLSPEEFEKMKIHPTVGSEILERVQFPYPVVPIVKAHHERWDGAGYPNGTKGEDIPIGARILAAVDCLDAVASDRQYRRALTLDEAVQVVVDDSGRAFDPKVVEVLQRRYRDFEALMKIQAGESVLKMPPTAEVKKPVRPHLPPGITDQLGGSEAQDFLQSIASARQEVQTLFELAQDLGNSLSLDETLSVLALRLRRVVPWESMAIYIRHDEVLHPEYVSGEDFRFFSSLEIRVGQGLSGWVAANQHPILNGAPGLEAPAATGNDRTTRLKSALAVPLQGVNGVLGVLTLYRSDLDAFNKDHLRILLAISSKVALSIENALRFRQAENSATTDYLTGLPNARSLFLQLDAELARARRTNTSVAVLVTDLDGFKAVNDRYGHLEGNRVLRLVATGLREACREYDYVARMGGDEFVIILPGLTGEAVESRLESFRSAARKAGLEVCHADAVGLSVGQAFYPSDGQDAESLLAEADRRMYKVKQETKHRTAVTRKLWDTDFPTTAVTIQ